MKWIVPVLALSGCGASSSVAPAPSNTTADPVAVARDDRQLEARSFTEGGATHLVWIGLDRIPNIDTNDACCGLAYDGNRYDDSLASCATAIDECRPGEEAVYPGLADDHVCGDRRRCVPLPLARLIVRDDTQADAVDGEEQPLNTGRDATTAHRPVTIGRQGFVYVTIAQRTERVALDYGGRYTITVGGGHIERVTRD